MILVLILSFNQLPIASLPITGWTLDWYREIFTDQAIRGAFGTSLKVAGLVVAIGLAIGLPTAFAVNRRSFVTKPAPHGRGHPPDRPAGGRRRLSLDPGDVPIPGMDPLDAIHRARPGDARS